LSNVLPDSPRELLGRNPLGIAKEMRIVPERDVRVSMAHKPGNDVNRGAGLEQFGRDSMPEAVDAEVNALRGFDSKFGHGPMGTILDYIVRWVRPSFELVNR
jgi:hypothetical protein